MPTRPIPVDTLFPQNTLGEPKNPQFPPSVTSNPQVFTLVQPREPELTIPWHVQLKSQISQFPKKLQLVYKAIGENSEDPSPERTNRSGRVRPWLGYCAVKLAGRAQLPSTLIGIGAMSTLEASNSTLATAGVAGLVAGCWSRISTGCVNHAVNNNQHVFSTAAQQFGWYSRNVSDSLPGLHDYSERHRDNANRSTRRTSALMIASTRLRRGIVATNKLTAYITAAGRAEHTPEERKKLARALSIDAGIVRGVAFGIIAESIVRVSEQKPALAEEIQQYIKNPLTWLSLGTIAMASEYIPNKLRSLRMSKTQQILPSGYFLQKTS